MSGTDWAALERGLIHQALDSVAALSHIHALFSGYKFSDASVDWIWGQIRYIYGETNETPSETQLRAVIDLLPEETQEPLIKALDEIYATEPEPKPKSTARLLLQRHKGLVAMDAAERAVTLIGRGDHAGGIATLAKAATSTAIRPGYVVKPLIPKKRRVWISQPRIPTGLYTLDQIIDGIQKGELGLIFGDTGVGKSVLGIEFGHTAILYGKKVLHVDTENGERLIQSRYMSRFTGIAQRLIENDTMGPDTRARLDDWIARNHERLAQYLRVVYLDFSVSTLDDFTAAVRSHIETGWKPDEIIFDSPDHLDIKDGDQRWERFADLYNKLKGLLGPSAFDCSMWALTQAADSEGKLATNSKVADSKQKPRNAAIALSVNPAIDPRTRRVIADSQDRCVFLSKNRNGPAKYIIPLQTDIARMRVKAPPLEWQRPPVDEEEEDEDEKEGDE